MNTTVSSVTTHQQDLPKTLRYITASFLTITCLLGLTGYSLMIVVIMKTQNIGGAVHATLNGGKDGGSRALLLNAYLSGLIGSGVLIPVYIANISGGTLVVPLLMCKIFGFLNVLTFNALLASSVAIAVRQCLLLATKTYGRYSERTSSLIIVVTWLIPLALALSATPHVGFNYRLLNCLFEDSMGPASSLLPIFLISTPALSAITAIFICYVILFQAMKKQLQSVQTWPQIPTVAGGHTASSALPSVPFWTVTRVRNTRLAVKLAVNWMIFATLWSPLACMYATSVRSTVSPQSWLVGSLLARLFYGMGWVLFGIWNERLRKTMKTLLLGLCHHRRRQVLPSIPRNEELVTRRSKKETVDMGHAFFAVLSNFQINPRPR